MAVAQAARPRSPVEVLTEAAVDFMSGRPINKEATIGAAESFFAQWSGSMGADYRPDMFDGARESTVHQRAQSGPASGAWYHAIFGGAAGPRTRQHGQPPPPPDQDVQRARQILTCRQILGFTPTEPLDEDKIKMVHRRLVRKNHPDYKRTPAERARADAKMRDINNARDVLLAAL
jgi:hypothetical protein